MKHLWRIVCFMNLIVNSYMTYYYPVYRLPNEIKPIRYILSVEPNLEPGLQPATYNGSVIIELKAVGDTNNITLHNRYINIDRSSIKVVGSDNSEIPVVDVYHNEELEIFTIAVERTLKQNNNYTLTIGNFYSDLGTQNVGFYLAEYKDTHGQERRLAVTDFEPGDARQAFPCFDEPGIKARFIINLIRKKEYNSLSNMELEKTLDLGNGRFQDCYKQTPVMSAYVVAFIISDFQPTKLTERHRIFARPGAVEEGKLDYTLDVSVKTLKALEDFSGINFPINKMDQFAIPDIYFKDDAMENWGLVIYGESHLFCTNKSSSEDIKRCTVYIAHEFGHQWFGNLVTPSWWTYTWLSEGFAGYFQYYTAATVQPSWRLMDQILIDNVHSALDRDSLSYATNILNYNITYNGEFPTLWLLYHKGSSIIRMTEHYLTHEVFKQGLRNFLKTKQYDSAEPSDLYKGLQRAVDDAGVNHLLGNLTVAKILTSWDSQVGYPVVNVTRDYKDGRMLFSQTKFVKSNNRETKYDSLWHIPINYAFESDSKKKFSTTTADFWLSEKQQTIDVNYPIDDWYLVNIHETGYYRVNYDPTNWERLIHILHSNNFEKIPVLNRAQLIDDAFDLAKEDLLPFNLALELSEYLVRERDPIPFGAFMSFVEKMEYVLPYQYSTSNRSHFLYFNNYTSPHIMSDSNKEYDVYKEYVKYVLSPIYEHIGFEENPTDNLLDKLYRTKIVTTLCDYKHVGCINAAIKLFHKFKSDTTTHVSPDLQNVVFCRGVTSQEDWNFVADLYIAKDTDATLREKLYEGLGCNTKYGRRVGLKLKTE